MTPLGRLIAAQIRLSGPMALDEYMRLCLLHPQHGYYATRDPFGAGGDFTTAPEISQIFGEMIGLALAQAWLDQGRPAPFTLAEIGPGRGTLMADILRAIRIVPGMAEAARVALVEASPHLRRVQRDRLGDIAHLDDVSQLPQAPLFLVANEFFDALPIRQFQRGAQGWAERVVALDAQGGLEMGLVPAADAALPAAPQGVIRETCPEALPIVAQVAGRIAAHGGCAILVDYGGWDGQGDTFQALRRHRPEDPLANPGEADLTAHVDFAPLAAAARGAGARVSRMAAQGDWLKRLGIEARAQRLARLGDAGAMAALHRLTAPDEMGHLFKVLALWARHAPVPAGFEPLDDDADDA
ncbi:MULTISPECIES: class I SAM-dependent methyltransferase [Paracoccus]|uniref:SAM-dependent MidA family methyltransferase n=1 Tax=Paracoccus versutus TaxID=34007 RepID=A0A3D9X9X3_PARVE|nr:MULTISPECIES: SAM-dependent methyltransferase [Paracoccus]REF67264.1 SAM-dependent MidA family methyltransferase [Paracoccus versutus]WGR58768.1 class I SAM-dependent methyltransferase [Paracoccus versutus]